MRDPLNVEVEHLREVNKRAIALVKVLDAIEAHPSFTGIWGFLFTHGYTYNGPNYALELADLKRLMDGELTPEQ